MLKKLLLCTSAFLIITQLYAQVTEEPEVAISLQALGGLQFDQVRFRVKPGAKVKIVLSNYDDMSHNLVFTKPGAREEVVEAALKLGEAGPRMNFVPDNSKVLWFIPVLSPGQEANLTFKAPKDQGIYPYVCTYPGHGYVMFGAMYVTNEAIPDLENDPNIPKPRKEQVKEESKHDLHKKTSGHPYDPVPPFLYRILIPDASPAAIAVRLPHEISYCWDAGTCRLRYAWQGEFLDPSKYWNVKGERFAKVSGTIFYRDKTDYPLRVNQINKIPAVNFKGYRLIDGYPEFQYSIDGSEVYELILPKADGTGLIRNFKIPDASDIIWFIFNPEDGCEYTSSQGQWVDGKLRLTPLEAKKFTITMSKKEGARL
ncbi:hypothetical protein BH23BAC1_BH23BAC1_09590 [soil metagenome]